MDNNSNLTNATACMAQPDEVKALTLILILVASVVFNVCTIVLITRFKIRKVPDILVIGLAVSDLFSVCIPVVISVFEYFNPCVNTEGAICRLFATLAHFSRYSSALIVTLVSIERYFAVNRPFYYRTSIGPYPYRFVAVLLGCWGVAAVLAVIPAVVPGEVCHHEGYCLFCLQSQYAIGILVYALVQYVVVCGSFLLVAVNLVKVYRRRKRMTSRGAYNARGRHPHEVVFTKPNLTSRISDLRKTLKTNISEKFQLGVEAEFGRMFFIVVLVFYSTWTTIVVLIIIAQIKGTENGLEDALFWGIRLTVVGTTINPLVYGIFARQYRAGYIYILRLVFSKICSCVDPPMKNVFADPQTEARSHDTHRYDQRTPGSSEPVLIHSRAAANFRAIPSTIRDVELLVPEEDFASSSDHSLHLEKVGELSSTVAIPQGLGGGAHEVASPRRSVSLDILTEPAHPQYLKTSSSNRLVLLLGEGEDAAGGAAMMHEDMIENRKIFHNPAFECGNDHKIGTPSDPSPTDYGGQTSSETGSMELLVHRSPILSNRGSTRGKDKTIQHQFEVPSLCTVVTTFREKGEPAVKGVASGRSEVEGVVNRRFGVEGVVELKSSNPTTTSGAPMPAESATPTTSGSATPTTHEEFTSPGNITLLTSAIMEDDRPPIEGDIETNSGVVLPVRNGVIPGKEEEEEEKEEEEEEEEEEAHVPTMTQVRHTITMLQQSSPVRRTSGVRRGSAMREAGNMTVLELRRQFEASQSRAAPKDRGIVPTNKEVISEAS